AAPEAENYKVWNVTRKGVFVTFDPYQVGPYAAGPQYVLVPFSALKSIMRPDGTVAAMAG
ncbi:MAG TPA: RsiV family protein, partial [Pyrinomonadaceae bacterium]